MGNALPLRGSPRAASMLRFVTAGALNAVTGFLREGSLGGGEHQFQGMVPSVPAVAGEAPQPGGHRGESLLAKQRADGGPPRATTSGGLGAGGRRGAGKDVLY